MIWRGRRAPPRAAGRRPGAERLPRPSRPLVPLVVAISVMLGWAAVVYETGSVWAEVAGTATACLVLAGFLLPPVELLRARLYCTESPADCVVGGRALFTIRPSRPLVLEVRDALGRAKASERPPVARPGVDATVEIVPEHVGQITSLVLTAATAAPLGLLWWERTFSLPLANPLHVAPTLGDPFTSAITFQADNAGRLAAVTTPSVIGELRGVVPYVPGHSRRWVHWPASAHSGRLMVREMEDENGTPATVVVALPEDPDEADALCGRVLATVVELLAHHHHVVMWSCEPTGARVSPVRSQYEAGRRLAAAERGCHPLQRSPVVTSRQGAGGDAAIRGRRSTPGTRAPAAKWERGPDGLVVVIE